MKNQSLKKNIFRIPRPVYKTKFQFSGSNAVRITVAGEKGFREAPFAKDVLLPQKYHSDISRTVFSDALFNQESGMITLGLPGKTLEVSANDGNRLIEIITEKGEGFYGFGEWFNGFRREEGELEIHNQESPAFLQHKQTYSAFPCFISDRGYMLFALNAHRAHVRINKPKGRLSIKFSGGGLDFFIIAGKNFKEIISSYTSLTGRPPLLPLWAFGLWNTAYPVENQAETLARIDGHRKRHIPLDAVILDYHWQEAFSNFRWRTSLFPDPVGMINKIKEAGIKAGLIYTPYINRDSFPLYKLLVRLYVKNAPDGVPILSKDYASDVFEEGMEKGYFAHDNVTWWLGRGGAVDFTNESACDWWFDMQKPLLDQGVYFFKNDGAEYLPKGSRSSIGLDNEEYHNVYCFYYTRALFERCRKYHGNKRALVFSRTNWAGTQRYPGIFLGDQTPEFKHIAAVMRCGLNMSLLGYSYWGADILALYKKPTPELHRRYSQFSIFSPISRYFSCPHDPDRNPWGIDSACEENFRRHIALKMRLLPYYYRLAREAYDTGIPIIRPLVMEFPDDPHARPIWQQLMLGEALMIAPVLEQNAKSIKVYFPKGLWHSWWDGISHEGPGWFDVPVDDGHLPLFVRGGRPVILGESLQFIPDGHRFDKLEVHAFAPFDEKAVLYEDDCSTLNYQSGKFSFQEFSFAGESDGGISIKISPASGSFDGQPETRRVTFILHGFGSPSHRAEPEGCTVDEIYYDEKNKTLKVSVEIKVRTGSVIRLMQK